VITCDNVETAKALYNECDGMELEASSAMFDLRYIPDGVTFNDHPPREVATRVPANYKPPSAFYIKGKQQSQVELTWDLEDPRRKELLQPNKNVKVTSLSIARVIVLIHSQT
jgi:hypothetical protein